MTGLPDYNRPAFHEAARLLHDAGYEPINPGTTPLIEGWDWSVYMRKGLADMFYADAVALLDGWETSRGARLEAHVATELGMTVLPLCEWVTP